MNLHSRRRQGTVRQRGVFLIEALIALLIFSLGILGMIAMGGSAMSAQTDARFRTDAAALADELASQIMLNVDRTDVTTIVSSVQAFEHRPSPSAVSNPPCAFTGTNTVNPLAIAWLTKVVTAGPNLPGLPGATADMQQIVVDTTATGFNRVQITVCWQAPTDTAPRRHVLVTYVNPETL